MSKKTKEAAVEVAPIVPEQELPIIESICIQSVKAGCIPIYTVLYIKSQGDKILSVTNSEPKMLASVLSDVEGYLIGKSRE